MSAGLRLPHGARMLLLLCLLPASLAWGQVADPWQGLRIEAVEVVLDAPAASDSERAILEDRVRKGLGVFPGIAFHPLLLDWGLSRVRSLPGVARAGADLAPGPTGGVTVSVAVSFRSEGVAAAPSSGLPIIWREEPDALLKLKLVAAGLVYANRSAWYAQPQAFVGANPLATDPSGAGWAPWAEGALEVGLQGIGPIAPSLYLYGSLSYMASGSAGAELFTSQTRSYGGMEDAYLGFVAGKTWDDGSRLVVNVTAGRQPFQIADGMLIRITAGNGFDRAALQLNPRWAADSLYMAEARYNATSVEVFRLDPDELPAIDTQTILYGVNVETGIASDRQWGLTVIHVPQSGYGYYTPTAAGTRAGLTVADARFYWLPVVPGAEGAYVKVEAAIQRNLANAFAMRAWGGYGEVGYTLATLPSSPTVSYRLSAFSGDNPATATYERWDPLISGGTPEEWVQGINHYKMFQDSNVVAHRLQVRLRTSSQSEVVPQLWYFSANQTNNLGGTVSTLAAKPLGWEVNVTGKYFPTRNLYMQAGFAATFPLSGVTGAIPGKLSPWLSAMALVRINY